MPLVKIFAKQTMSKPIPLASLQSKLCNIWGTKPNTTKLMLCRVEDWTDESFHEDCYVDIRAYGKEGTRLAKSKVLWFAVLFHGGLTLLPTLFFFAALCKINRTY
jgi:hypothetical protein